MTIDELNSKREENKLKLQQRADEIYNKALIVQENRNKLKNMKELERKYKKEKEDKDENNYLNYGEYNQFTLIPNKELFNICATNSDINDINEGMFDKKKLNRYLTYPFDETNIFIVMKQPKEKTKNSLMNNIKERLKNKKKYNKRNN